MTYLGPPKGVSAARLFREMMRRPRPVWPLSLRMSCAPAVRLAARALTAWEDEEARDVPEDLPPDVRLLEAAQRLLVASLLADGQPAFTSADDLGAFDEFEIRAMAAGMFDALAVVMPSYRRIDETAWSKRLEEGAAHASNISITLAVGASAIEIGTKGAAFLPHWDRFFGLPFADITDGQRMAYAAARKVYEGWCK